MLIYSILNQPGLFVDKLKTENKYVLFKKGEDLLDYLRKMVIWIEKFYADIATRVNWLLTNTVEDHTEDDTLTEYETDSVHSNLGATGTITLTLPTVTVSGVKFTFSVQAAQELRIDPAAATILDISGQTADKYKWADAVGEGLVLISNSSGDWYVIAKAGTWTEE